MPDNTRASGLSTIGDDTSRGAQLSVGRDRLNNSGAARAADSLSAVQSTDMPEESDDGAARPPGASSANASISCTVKMPAAAAASRNRTAIMAKAKT